MIRGCTDIIFICNVYKVTPTYLQLSVGSNFALNNLTSCSKQCVSTRLQSCLRALWVISSRLMLLLTAQSLSSWADVLQKCNWNVADNYDTMINCLEFGISVENICVYSLVACKNILFLIETPPLQRICSTALDLIFHIHASSHANY